jgi:predicted ATPase/DNA-binding SARP family transcriptional activator
MRFVVLGPLGVIADGRRVTLPRGHQRTILALLLAADGGYLSTDRLVDALWGARPPPTARKSLQSHVSRLRQHLHALAPADPVPLDGEPDGYRLRLADIEIDADRFRDLVEQARHVRDPAEALGLLDEALACWHGPAFGDLAEHPDVATAAQRLEQERAAAAADRIDVLLALRRHDEALQTLPARIEQDTFDERAHGQLMRALVAAGRQAEALGVFREVQRRLRDELGVDPSPQLRRLHEEILRQEPGTPSSPPRVRKPGEWSRAPRSDPLLGRERDLETLRTWLRSAALVTLTGPGGVGKTRLAEQVVAQIGGAWRDGVISVALAHVRDAEGVGGALVTALAIQPSGGQSVTDALVLGLGDRNLLLFLDNCEHVLEAVAPHVEAILARCTGVTVLATSRERLRLTGERIWPVTPLDVPAEGATAPEVLATSAGELFRLRAEAVEPSFTLGPANTEAVGELCRRLDGMPLAIELAAARIRALAPADLVERLDRRFAVLAGGPRHEGGRHRTLEAVVAWSYDLLEPREADLFDRLAVFAGAVPLDGAEEVCAGDDLPRDEIAGLLGELVDKSMVVVQRDGDQVRYRLLDTMRDFGTRRLERRGITEQLRRMHAHHHVTVAETQGARVRGPEEPAAVRVLDRAMDDLRAAHVWAVAADDIDTALRLPAALTNEVTYRLRDEVTTWAHRALALPGARAHPSHAAALATAAWGATCRDDCERAVKEAAEACAGGAPGGPVAVHALGALATAARYEGRLADVLVEGGRLAEVAERNGDDFHLAFARVDRSLALLYGGDVPEAAAEVALLHGIADRCGSPTMLAFARYCDGEVNLERDPDHAAASLEEAVTLARSVGNRLLEGVSLVCLASSQGRRGDTREALRVFREVVAHWRRVGDHTHQLTTVRNLVELLAQIEADEPAAILYGAVTSGDTPTYGAEAARIERAWERITDRLGHQPAGALADRGHRLGARRVGDEALVQLDALLAT